MTHKFNIELEDEIYQQLKNLCKDDEGAIQEYIVKILKHNIHENLPSNPSGDQDSLESYLNKGQPGSRNYGVKGQGW